MVCRYSEPRRQVSRHFAGQSQTKTPSIFDAGKRGALLRPPSATALSASNNVHRFRASASGRYRDRDTGMDAENKSPAPSPRAPPSRKEQGRLYHDDAFSTRGEGRNYRRTNRSRVCDQKERPRGPRQTADHTHCDYGRWSASASDDYDMIVERIYQMNADRELWR
jgi:hypothetical protein